MNLSELKKRRTEIIKAEIGSLLFNLGKTHMGFWKKYFDVDEDFFQKEYGYSTFTGYKKYYNQKGNIPFKVDLENTNKQLKKFFYETEINFNFEEVKSLKLVDIVYGDAIKNDNKNLEKFIKKIFFYGCENINSGIDKGTPPEDQQLKSLWISNAFGIYKEKVIIENLDRQRLCFFARLWNKIDSMNNKPEDFSHYDWVVLRNFVLAEVKNWYQYLLSDSRYPANDVTLWEQAYMSASMFKATLAALSLDLTSYNDYLTQPRTIRWSIMGVQYDKLELAEKSLKLPFVEWYRENTRIIDDKIKRLIEIEYTLGNEIYRDETGIYFIVPENAGKEDSGDAGNYLLPLSDGLNELKKDILNSFTEIFDGEVYPAIFVTKPTRGTMNLTYLLEKSRENFLQASYPDNIVGILVKQESTSGKNNRYTGLCQVCGLRLGNKRKQGLILCDICSERETSRLKKWIQTINRETIWSGDLQDEEGRIALFTVKFELKEWLNGNLLNTFLINIIKWNKTKQALINDIKELIKDKTYGKKLKKIGKTILNKIIKVIGVNLEDFINSVLFERSINDNWLSLLEANLGEKINIKKQKVEWEKLTDEDIDFLAEIFLQFLLRKNPSPARLRRIWETTEEFFIGLRKELKSMMKIEEWRFKRPVWKGLIKEESQKEKEYTYRGLDF